MERSERPDALSPITPHQHSDEDRVRPLTPAERLLTAFTPVEQQRLRALRERYERGRLSEFPRRAQF